MADDPLWAELRRLDGRDRDSFADLVAAEERRRPRLDPKYGTCPVCAQGASEAFVFSPLTWLCCDGCGVRWCVGELLAPLTDDEAQQFHLRVLCEYDAAPPIQTISGEKMPPTKQAPSIVAPAPTCKVSFRRFPGAQGLALPRGLRPDEEIVATNYVLRDLLQHPDDNIHRRWERCRSLEVSDGMPLDRALYRDRACSQGSDFEVIVQVVRDALARRGELASQLAALDAVGADVSLPVSPEVSR